MPKRNGTKVWSSDLQTYNPRPKRTVTPNPHAETPAQTQPPPQVAPYDKWFRAEVAQALEEADNPATLWLDNATVMAQSAQRRASWSFAIAVSDSAAHHPARLARLEPSS